MSTTDERPSSDAVANLADLAEGTMKMVKVDGHRVCLVRTSSGVHAIDHACPHEGYGLTQGDLNGELLTCAWHNWKFRVTDGACVQGEEGVTVHDVDVDTVGDVRVTINRPDPEVVRQRTQGQPAQRHRTRLHRPGLARRGAAPAGQRASRRADLGGGRVRRAPGRVRVGALDRVGDRLPGDGRSVRR